MHELILYAGLGILFFGAIGIIMTAFRTNVLWGLGVFIPPITLVYVFSHWQEAKGPFKTLTLGALLIAGFAYMNGGMAAITTVNTPVSHSTLSEPDAPPTAVSQVKATILAAPTVDRMNQPSVSFAPPVHVTRKVSTSNSNVKSASFTCDGRRHCSQMTSCAEAKYFLKNCPNTKMDGDGDGIPCESQWCKG